MRDGGALASRRRHLSIDYQFRCFRSIHFLTTVSLYPDIATVDKTLSHIPRSKIRDQLLEVGFDDARQAELVGGLSGGWKMKLELARAMLYNADLLLLDEVSSFKLETECKLISTLNVAYQSRMSTTA